ncbi:MAG: hypothetical protein ACYCZH_03950 [Sulfuriferula sp.]
MAGNESDSSVRWQEVTREHLGGLINLVLGLAAGLLAFESTLLLERKFTAPCAFGLGLLAVVMLSVSVGFALWCAVNRLSDFRLTTQIARGKEKGATDLEEKRDESRLLGKTTWRLLKAQLWLFGLGAAAGAVAVLLQVVQ